MENYQILWKNTLDCLEKNISGITFSTFVEKLDPVDLDGSTLILHTESKIFASGTMRVYNKLIAAFKEAKTGITDFTLYVGNSETPFFTTKKTEEEADSSPIEGKYTFDSVVVGENNRFAHAAAVAVAENPAEAYNPLFIHGGVGLGKTHLMHAIGHYVQQQYPEKRLLSVTSETFINELISAIPQGRNTQFRNRFRNVDILMVDDIQFIAGKDSTQEEFFHTFNELFDHGKQIILTSDKPPQEIAKLEERLRSRFAWGLIADIQRPDVETRTAILRAKAISEGVTVPDEVLGLIADHVNSNIRELEGSFNKLLAYSQLSSEPITMDLARIALRDILNGEKHRQITAGMIMQTVCEYFSVTIEDLTSATRKREITVPRQIAMFLTRDLTAMSLPQIGTAFGNRDHTT
ncbi:MAG: chromosomal replication initiator protein DnaA, partial [Clostridia bacterium]|nr:chromosomal replication initiator protein DnaA [Clostridia bacterium]